MTKTRLIHRCVSFGWLLVIVAALGLLPGCSTVHNLFGGSSNTKPNTAPTAGEEIAGRLRTGDAIQIRMDTSGSSSTAPVSSDLSIDEDGNISLPLVGSIKAAGLTPSERGDRIEAKYVPRFYVRCTATVLVAQRRFIYVGGEVRNPGRFPWSEDMTLMKAINTASGFTDYANRQKAQLTREGKLEVYNCEELQRNPAKDPVIRPGDSITIPRSIF
jgi:polysaccharide export outer membrane protein